LPATIYCTDCCSYVPGEALSNPKEESLGRFLALTSAVFYSTRSVMVRFGLDTGAGVPELAALRMLFCSLFFFIALRVSGKHRQGPKYLIAQPRMVAGAAFFSLSIISSFYAVSLIGVALTVIIIYIHPVFVALLSRIFLGQKLGLKRTFFLATTYAGTVMAVAPKLSSGDQKQILLGTGLSLTAALSYAFYQLFVQRFSQTVPSIRIVATSSYLAMVPTFFLWHFDPPTVPLAAVGITAAMGGFSTFLPLTLLGAAITRIGAARASIFSMISPVMALTLAWLFFGELLSPVQWVGGTVVMVSVGGLLMSRRS
jgi:drug/metabolite transporter (DMT)-like permease